MDYNVCDDALDVGCSWGSADAMEGAPADSDASSIFATPGAAQEPRRHGAHRQLSLWNPDTLETGGGSAKPALAQVPSQGSQPVPSPGGVAQYNMNASSGDCSNVHCPVPSVRRPTFDIQCSKLRSTVICEARIEPIQCSGSVNGSYLVHLRS